MPFLKSFLDPGAERDEDERSLCSQSFPSTQCEQPAPAGRTSQSLLSDSEKLSVGIIFNKTAPLSQCPQGKSNTILAQPLSQHWGWFQAPPKSTTVATVEIKKNPLLTKVRVNFPFHGIFTRKLGFVAKFWQCDRFSPTLPSSRNIVSKSTEENCIF